MNIEDIKEFLQKEFNKFDLDDLDNYDEGYINALQNVKDFIDGDYLEFDYEE